MHVCLYVLVYEYDVCMVYNCVHVKCVHGEGVCMVCLWGKYAPIYMFIFV